jgi:hypothetical protein
VTIFHFGYSSNENRAPSQVPPAELLVSHPAAGSDR